jgi:hypothetical protein
MIHSFFVMMCIMGLLTSVAAVGMRVNQWHNQSTNLYQVSKQSTVRPHQCCGTLRKGAIRFIAECIIYRFINCQGYTETAIVRVGSACKWIQIRNDSLTNEVSALDTVPSHFHNISGLTTLFFSFFHTGPCVCLDLLRGPPPQALQVSLRVDYFRDGVLSSTLDPQP